MLFRSKGSVADFDEAIKLDPSEAGVYMNRGSSLAMLGEKARALADYEMAIKIDPTHPLHHVSRAMLLAEMGKRADAIAGLKKALAIAPNFPPSLEQLKKIEAKS